MQKPSPSPARTAHRVAPTVVMRLRMRVRGRVPILRTRQMPLGEWADRPPSVASGVAAETQLRPRPPRSALAQPVHSATLRVGIAKRRAALDDPPAHETDVIMPRRSCQLGNIEIERRDD